MLIFSLIFIENLSDVDNIMKNLTGILYAKISNPNVPIFLAIKRFFFKKLNASCTRLCKRFARTKSIAIYINDGVSF